MKTKIAHKELANARYNQMRQNMPSVLSSWQERIVVSIPVDSTNSLEENVISHYEANLIIQGVASMIIDWKYKGLTTEELETRLTGIYILFKELGLIE